MVTAQAKRVSNEATARGMRGLDGAARGRCGRAVVLFAVTSGGQDVPSVVRAYVLARLGRRLTNEELVS
jgi:hypothetical protein